MKRFIGFLLYGCFHTWQTINVKRLANVNNEVIGTRYILRCEKCGEVKKKDLR